MRPPLPFASTTAASPTVAIIACVISAAAARRVSVRSVGAASSAAAFARPPPPPPPSVRSLLRRRTATTSGLGVSLLPQEGGGGDGDDDYDQLKWERLYAEGEMARSAAVSAASVLGGPPSSDLGLPATSYSTVSEVRAVTFDLDNTLWKTGNVIRAANDALASFLEERGVVAPVRTEAVMGELFQEDKARYCPDMRARDGVVGVEVNGGAHGDGDDAGSGDDGDDDGDVNIRTASGARPVLLTQLRKDAVRRILLEHNSYSETDAVALAEEAFRIWTEARHDAIPSNYAADVVRTLEYVRSALRSNAEGRPVVVGAVTDGNSDPRAVPALAPHFDFVVNAEGVGVSKPDRRVYVAAMREMWDRVEELGDLAEGRWGKGPFEEERAEEIVGPWWCHVGDDFVKDCVAAKELKMRSIWCRELILPPVEERTVPSAATGTPAKKRDVADLVKDLSNFKGAIQMTIGAEDFLADSIQREFADEIVDEFREVGTTLRRWHEEAATATVTASGGDPNNDNGADPRNEDAGGAEPSPEEMAAAIAEVLEVVVPDAPPPIGRAEVGGTAAEAAALSATTKFCVYCGTKLPMAARFCSSCGEKQPYLE